MKWNVTVTVKSKKGKKLACICNGKRVEGCTDRYGTVQWNKINGNRGLGQKTIRIKVKM